MTQFGRVLVVRVADLIITEPRITAQITLDDSNSQDTGTVAIYNLSPDNHQRVFERSTEIEVQGGYRGRVGTLFAGAVQRVRPVRRVSSGVARVTVIELGTYSRSVAPVAGVAALGGISARSYDGPQNIRSIVGDLAKDAGLAVAGLDAVPANATAADWAWSGASSDGLTALLATVDCGWYEDGGKLRVRRRGASAQPDAGRWLITPQTGLVGAPTPSDEGPQVRVLLNAGIQRGSMIDLRSETISGEFTVVALSHNADNWEGHFVTDLETRPG